ncbi:MAG: hypothetical protein ACK2U5_19130 [Candidatus Promineifilaceae bacterium]|jgi:hypothetical protein
MANDQQSMIISQLREETGFLDQYFTGSAGTLNPGFCNPKAASSINPMPLFF